MPTPSSVTALVAKFTANRDSYVSPQYNEAQLRKEFLDPMLEALGWDVGNKQGFAEAYKEVINEDAVKVGTATKAPDYSFRIGGVRKFFVEAKKPSVDIHEDPSPAFQLRRYAWSAKMPLSVLTDFHEFAVYDCRVKPSIDDKAGLGRLLYLKYTEYEARWDEIAGVFSKDAVLKGSFDKYAESTRGKKGTTEVDAAFLAEIESWRDELARTIALRNSRLSQRELNFAVQRTIDRIIFLRICEDRGIEEPGRLQAHLNGDHVYKRLCVLFREADERYNSGLFHFRTEKDRDEAPDSLTLSLDIDDKPLKDIIRGLYYPESPYEFSVLPADILGQVYEQFLGKVIRLTAGHRAVVEDKPEVKKAGGVFYTPTYIVNYIVKNTVGRLLPPLNVGPVLPGMASGTESVGEASATYDGKPVERTGPVVMRDEPSKGRGPTAKDAAKVRILDPACGSGTFLIGAYQYLLDWYRDWYVLDGAEKWMKGRSPTLSQTRAGEYRLTTPERKRILLNNIYGVDIDSQAVEVTKLSLLLKVLEGESQDTLNLQLKLFRERALPDLGKNVKCGNSLVGNDFYEGVQEAMPLFGDGDETRLRLNAFDWEGADGFRDVVRAGGFDVVIGNPPYVRVQELEHHVTDYLKRTYETAWKRIDISVLFIELANRLLNRHGINGYITSNQFLTAEYGRKARRFLLSRSSVCRIVDFGDLPVFKGALTYVSVFFLSKGNTTSFEYHRVRALDEPSHSYPFSNVNASSLGDDAWALGKADHLALIARLRATHPVLGRCARCWYGIITGLDDVLIVDNAQRRQHRLEKEALLPLIRAQDCTRYGNVVPSKYVVYPYEEVQGRTTILPEADLRGRYPNLYRYLVAHRAELNGRKDSRHTVAQSRAWYSLIRFGQLDVFSAPKILTPGEVKGNKFTLDRSTAGYSGARVYGVVPTTGALPAPALLAVLNSKVVQFYMHSVAPLKQGGYYSYSSTFVETIPVPDALLRPGDPAVQELARMATTMLSLAEKAASARTAQERTTLERQSTATDSRIDRLVYRVYGLTEAETAIVEAGAV
ncbi:MAG: Eco57I restriction-modification methylase domain-containing protein [Armatimonadetes bacterium]|nr:Eco57I restriction-modification methylase domain-containing protein [Armatimonadota bacterium]